jgi:hypothetical protein
LAAVQPLSCESALQLIRMVVWGPVLSKEGSLGGLHGVTCMVCRAVPE